MYTPTPFYSVVKTSFKTTALAFMLSQILLANDASNEIVFKSDNSTNSGANYALIKGSILTISEIQEDIADGKTPIPQNSKIIFENTWSNNLGGFNGIQINTPTSDLVFKALSGGRGAGLESFYSQLNITAKTIAFGDGSVEIANPFAGFKGDSNTIPAAFQALNSGSILDADVVVNKDGIFTTVLLLPQQLQEGSNEVRTTITKNLTIDSGSIMGGSQLEGKTTILQVGGKAVLKDINVGLLMASDNTKIDDVLILRANQGVDLQGVKSAAVFSWAQPGDLVDGLETIKGSDGYDASQEGGFTYQLPYALDVSVKGDALVALPKLTDEAKQKDLKTLVNDSKNSVVQHFYDEWKDKSDGSNGFTQEQIDAVKKIFKDYLATQGIDADTKKPIITTGDEKKEMRGTILATTGSMVSKAVDTSAISTAKAEDVDQKLVLLTNKDNGIFSEAIKNSENNKLSVGFVASASTPYNTLALDLIGEVKEGMQQSKDALDAMQENLGTKMAVMQRIMSYKPVIKAQQEKPENPNLEIIEESGLNHLWINAFGGSGILGSNIGGNAGVALGYDNNIGNAILGGYVAYLYNYLKDSLGTLDAQGIEAGFYSRSSFDSHQLDVNLKTQVNFVFQEKKTLGIASNTKADSINSYTNLEIKYGYIFGKESLFSKPFIGINAGYSIIPSYQDNGDIAFKYEAQNDVRVGVSLGVEIKKIFENQSFLYVIPSLEQGVFVLQDSVRFSSIASGTNMQTLNLYGSNKTYAQLLFGGEIRVDDSWNIGLGFAIKQALNGVENASKEWKNQTFVTGSISGIYKF